MASGDGHSISGFVHVPNNDSTTDEEEAGASTNHITSHSLDPAPVISTQITNAKAQCSIRPTDSRARCIKSRKPHGETKSLVKMKHSKTVDVGVAAAGEDAQSYYKYNK